MKRFLSRDFFVFLVFLISSAVFWVFTTLNETFEAEIGVHLEIADVPSNTVITESLPDTIRVTVRDKGYYLVKYLYTDKSPVLRIPFRLYAGQQNHGAITQGELQKMLRPHFGETCVILSIKADHLDFYYSHGSEKRVPLIFSGNALAKTNYYIMDVQVVPDSVTVMAPSSALDTIHAVYTVAEEIDDLDATVSREIPLAHIVGTKTNVKSAKVRISVDQLTETVVTVPVRAIHLPSQTILKTFPGRVDVRVSVGAKEAAGVKAKDFSVVADYNDLAERSPKDKLPISIEQKPDNVLKAWLTVNEVDYVIEHTR